MFVVCLLFEVVVFGWVACLFFGVGCGFLRLLFVGCLIWGLGGCTCWLGGLGLILEWFVFIGMGFGFGCCLSVGLLCFGDGFLLEVILVDGLVIGGLGWVGDGLIGYSFGFNVCC